jgi:hypothetical protein
MIKKIALAALLLASFSMVGCKKPAVSQPNPADMSVAPVQVESITGGSGGGRTRGGDGTAAETQSMETAPVPD